MRRERIKKSGNKNPKLHDKKFEASSTPDSHCTSASLEALLPPDTATSLQNNIGLLMHRGYFKVWRKLEDSAIYQDTPCFRVFFDLLIQSKWNPGVKKIFNGQEITLKPGQLTTGRHELAFRLGLTESAVYRALIKCQNVYHCITLKSNKRWTLITILNWGTYQNSNNENEQRANNGRTTGEHTLRKKEGKKERKKSKRVCSHTLTSPKKGSRSQLVRAVANNETANQISNKPTSIDEVQAFMGSEEEAAKFWDYFSSNGWKVGGKAPMKDWQAAARNWLRRSSKSNLSRGQLRTQKSFEEFKQRRVYEKTHEGKLFPFGDEVPSIASPESRI